MQIHMVDVDRTIDLYNAIIDVFIEAQADRAEAISGLLLALMVQELGRMPELDEAKRFIEDAADWTRLYLMPIGEIGVMN